MSLLTPSRNFGVTTSNRKAIKLWSIQEQGVGVGMHVAYCPACARANMICHGSRGGCVPIGGVAQLVERRTLTPKVEGSNPSSPANLKCPRCCVVVPYDKILQKDRCLVKPSCPLNDLVTVTERLVADGVEPL
jgi:hypothetical protein